MGSGFFRIRFRMTGLYLILDYIMRDLIILSEFCLSCSLNALDFIPFSALQNHKVIQRKHHIGALAMLAVPGCTTNHHTIFFNNQQRLIIVDDDASAQEALFPMTGMGGFSCTALGSK